MPFTLDYGLSLREAISRSADVWDVMIAEWGVRPESIPGTRCIDAYPLITEPGIADSIAGIAIGPRSDVDRCWISFNPSKILNNANPDYALRMLTAENPLMFSTPGKQAPPVNTFPKIGGEQAERRVAARNNLFYIWPEAGYINGSIGSVALGNDTTVVPRYYVKEDGSFASMNVFGSVNNQVFIPPLLHLRFLLREGVATYTKRGVATYKQYGNPGRFATPGAERTITQIPVYGRKTIRMVVGSTVADAVVRLAGLPSVAGSFDTTPALNQEALYAQEVTLGQKTIATARHSVSFCVSPANVDYLMLYATVPVNGNIWWTMAAHD